MKREWRSIRWLVVVIIYICLGKMEWEWMQGIVVVIAFIFSIDDLTSDGLENREQLVEREQKIQEIEVRVGKLEAFMKVRKYSNQPN